MKTDEKNEIRAIVQANPGFACTQCGDEGCSLIDQDEQPFCGMKCFSEYHGTEPTPEYLPRNWKA